MDIPMYKILAALEHKIANSNPLDMTKTLDLVQAHELLDKYTTLSNNNSYSIGYTSPNEFK